MKVRKYKSIDLDNEALSATIRELRKAGFTDYQIESLNEQLLAWAHLFILQIKPAVGTPLEDIIEEMGGVNVLSVSGGWWITNTPDGSTNEAVAAKSPRAAIEARHAAGKVQAKSQAPDAVNPYGPVAQADRARDS